METDLAKEIFEKVRQLSMDDQADVLRIVEQKTVAFEKRPSKPIWEVITEISSEIPDEEWEKLPADGSVNHDHYLYGGPKKY